MKRILLAVLATTALCSASASAADLPQRPAYKAPVMVAPVANWTGCYIGGNVGGAFGDASASSNGLTASGSASGFAGGGQIGCDYQFAGGFVIGIRDMFDGTSISQSESFPVGAFGAPAGTYATGNLKNPWFDTLTARLGYAVMPDWLLYFQGGAAWAHTTTTVTYNGTQYGQVSTSSTGWTIGGGVDWMFAPHWSAFLEGNYMEFGSTSGSVTANGVVYPYSGKGNETTVLVGVNYHFF